MALRIISLSLKPPALGNNMADADRLLTAVKKHIETHAVTADLELLRQLPDLLRKYHWEVQCVLIPDRTHWILTGILSARHDRLIGGLAVDLGTTRVVLRLIDLSTGRHIAESEFDNPQIAIGPDILTRIHYADREGGLEDLTARMTNELNRQIAALCHSVGLAPADVYAMALAGNTAMTHLFMGLTPHHMIREPYIPAVNIPPMVKASDLGIRINPFARLMIFPNIGSYFGGDLIAGILFCGLHRREEPAILVDVGTNAEVVLGNRHWLMGCAGAAGPALEGGVTRMGMMAGPGVIDAVTIDPKTYEFHIHTIADKPPKGICGSGLIDLAAQLFACGMLDIRGKLVPEVCGTRLTQKDGIRYLTVVPAHESATGKDLTISQADIDSLIRSKAAMYTILETITMTVGMTLNELSAFYVAGTFGCFIKPQSAITIGMLPDLPLHAYIPIGNSSLGGASLWLTSDHSLKEIDHIRDMITYLELNVNQEFMNRFSAAKFLPHTNRLLFPSVSITAGNNS